ncbi:MAG: hypothetical protein V3W32_09670 [Gemmatimonadota bacterium]
MSHLTDGQLHAVLDGSAEDPADAGLSGVRSHLEGCADCRARLEAARLVRDRAHSLLRVAAPPSLAPPPIQELAPARSGRPAGRRSFGPRPESLAWAATIAVALTAGWLARGMIDTETAGRFADAGMEQLAEPREVVAANEIAPAPERALRSEIAPEDEIAPVGNAFAELDRDAGADQPVEPPESAKPAEEKPTRPLAEEELMQPVAGEGGAAKMARRIDGAAAPAAGPRGWVRVDRTRAETLLDGRLRTVEGLPILSIFARDVEGTPVVWTAQQLASGHTLNLRQSPVEVSDSAQARDAVRANRKIDDAAEAGARDAAPTDRREKEREEGLAGFESVERVQLGGFLIEASAPLSPDSLHSLLSRLEG